MTPEQILDRIVRDPTSCGLFLDFDGTLAPIVVDPATSRLGDGLDSVLARISPQVGVLAVISGRPAQFLAARVAVPGAVLLGVYGTESWRDGRTVARPEAVEWEPALDEARDLIMAGLEGRRGVMFEDKGLALALHWRRASDRVAAERFVTGLVVEIAARTGLAIEPGKLVAELRPPLRWDKGSAVRALSVQHRIEFPVYAGDDLGDLPALDAVRRAGGAALVVDHGAETADAVRAAGDAILDGTDGVARWLRRLDEALPGPPALV